MKPLRLVVVVTVLVAASALARAQMQPFSRYMGTLYPVVDCRETKLFVLNSGKHREAKHADVVIRSADGFGSGSVEILNVVADLDPLRNAPPAERARPNAVAFRFDAEVRSDKPLEGCYALLVFVADGTIGTRFLPIGKLNPGRPKKVKCELSSRVDAVGHLHVFSGTQELLSTQVTGPYDPQQYFDGLTTGARGIPAAALCKSEAASPFALSDDGQRLATARDRGEGWQSLIVYDLASMKLLCDVKAGEISESISNLTWVPGDRIAFVSGGNLHLLDVATSKSEKIKEDVYRIMGVVRDRPAELVLMRFEWGKGIWTTRYNVETRKTAGVDELNAGYTIYDENGDARVRYSYEGDGRVYFYRPRSGGGWRALDGAVKQAGLKFSVRGRELLDRTADIHSIGPDGDTLYISTRQGGDRFELAAFSLSEGVVRKVVAKHPRYDLNTDDGGLSRLLFRKGSGELIGMVYEAQKVRVLWLDPTFAAAQKTMDESFPDHVNIPVDWSRDGDAIVYFTFSDQDPGTYQVFRPFESKLVPILVMGDYLKGRTLARTVPFVFDARDGVRIPAYLTEPPDRGEASAPLVVRIHGGPTARDSWGYDATNQYLATRGYMVLQVNYRGSSGYGAAFQKAGLWARLDTVVLDDIEDGVRHLVALGAVDPKRVGVMGGSFGGWATYMSLIKYPDTYRAGVAFAGVSHWRKALRDSRWRFENKLGFSFWKALLEHEDFAAQEPFIDPLLRASELRQPIYIMHGERDAIVHATQSRDMIEALKKHNGSVEALSFPLAGHGGLQFAERVTELNEIGAFFGRHLAPVSPSGSAEQTVAPVR